jgi:hypothetical protein
VTKENLSLNVGGGQIILVYLEDGDILEGYLECSLGEASVSIYDPTGAIVRRAGFDEWALQRGYSEHMVGQHFVLVAETAGEYEFWVQSEDYWGADERYFGAHVVLVYWVTESG